MKSCQLQVWRDERREEYKTSSGEIWVIYHQGCTIHHNHNTLSIPHPLRITTNKQIWASILLSTMWLSNRKSIKIKFLYLAIRNNSERINKIALKILWVFHKACEVMNNTVERFKKCNCKKLQHCLRICWALETCYEDMNTWLQGGEPSVSSCMVASFRHLGVLFFLLSNAASKFHNSKHLFFQSGVLSFISSHPPPTAIHTTIFSNLFLVQLSFLLFWWSTLTTPLILYHALILSHALYLSLA